MTAGSGSHDHKHEASCNNMFGGWNINGDDCLWESNPVLSADWSGVCGERDFLEMNNIGVMMGGNSEFVNWDATSLEEAPWSLQSLEGS
jgi:hypothetical protein